MIEKLSDKEYRRLRHHLLYNGGMKDCASKTGIPLSTLYRIVQTSKSAYATIQKLRVYINYKQSRIFIDTAA